MGGCLLYSNYNPAQFLAVQATVAQPLAFSEAGSFGSLPTFQHKTLQAHKSFPALAPSQLGL